MALFGAAPVAGQGLTVSAVGGLAYEPGGSGAALAGALAAAGYDDFFRGACAGGTCPNATQYPFYHNTGLDLAAFAGVRIHPPGPFSLEALVSNGQRGHAEGYDQETRRHLLVAYASFILSAGLGVHLGPLRLEAGPALNRIGWEVTRNSASTVERSTVTLGGMAAVSGELRVGDALVSLRAGLRRFRPADLRTRAQVPLEPDYRSLIVGLTVTGWTDR